MQLLAFAAFYGTSSNSSSLQRSMKDSKKRELFRMKTVEHIKNSHNPHR